MRKTSTTVLRSAILAALGASLGACGAGTVTSGDGGMGLDGGTAGPDGSIPDGSILVDGSLPDGAIKDGSLDGDIVDGSLPPSTLACMSPQPVLVAGKDTGFDRCAGGRVRRREAKDCPSNLPRAGGGVCPFGDGGGGGTACGKDSDCTAKPLGVCANGGNAPNCTCSYGCTKDSDCTTGQICQCGDPVGACVPATCTSPASCGGAECADYDDSLGCGFTKFACQTSADTCFTDESCKTDAANGMCVYDSMTKSRSCKLGGCAIGRPFLVDGSARVAPVASRREWSAVIDPRTEHLDAMTRAELARHWTLVAQLEHASIAAFARFALELLAFGAPPDLLMASHRAMLDETAHARLTFGLASAYAGQPVGPGPLSIAGAIEPGSLASFLTRVVQEGCVGETLGALEAQESATLATDPVVRDALVRIAEDETRHAVLAWQTVKWVLEIDPTLAGTVDAAIERGLVETLASLDHDAAGATNLGPHGVLTSRERARLARAAVREVIRPCAEACVSPMVQVQVEPPCKRTETSHSLRSVTLRRSMRSALLRSDAHASGERTHAAARPANPALCRAVR